MNVDPVIVALFNRLPASESTWPLSERLLWLSAMEGALNLIYGSADDIGIATAKLTVKPEGVTTPASQVKPGAAQMYSGEAKPYVAFVDNGDGSASEVSLTEGQAAALGVDKETADRVREIEGKPLPVQISAPRKSTRPDSCPSNLEMALAAIDHHEGRASAPQIEAYVRKNFWPDVSAKWTNCLWGFVPSSHLARDGINFVRGDRSKPVSNLPVAAPKKPAPTPAPAPANLKPAEASVKFEHGGLSVNIPARGYVYASKLKAVIGQHISEAFLAEKVIGSNSESNRSHVRSTCLALNEALAELGLKIEHHAGFGLLMKEI